MLRDSLEILGRYPSAEKHICIVFPREASSTAATGHPFEDVIGHLSSA